MRLEFELQYNKTDDKCIIYNVMRKGLQVGTLTLDKSPYNVVRIGWIEGK